MTYRPEIDGLRAIAVAAVVLFHAEIFGFTGGFVGVDVFFVISGFLISSIILKDMDDGKFSIVAFWERRIRRIMPAAIVLMAVVLIVGYWFLLPNDYERLGASVLAQVAFAANFLFWQEAGYFGPVAEQTPLLHTWSLAVEEQFYLAFPLGLVLITRFFTRGRTAILVSVFIISLMLSVWASPKWPDAAFFLAPTRVWELLAGALLALHATRLGALRGPFFVRELLAVTGLAMVAIAIITFDDSTVFPGYYAALPVAGTVMFMAANTGVRTRIGSLIANRLFVAIGLISYSLYLWHWPMLIFAKNISGDLTTPEVTLVLAFSVVLAYASYRWVETPFRRRSKIRSRRMVFSSAAVGVLIVSSIALVPFSRDGLPGRLPDSALTLLEGTDVRFHCVGDSLYEHSRGNDCVIGDTEAEPAILVWGDSHAGALASMLDDAAINNGTSMRLATHSLCPPIAGIRKPSRPECDEFNSEVIQSILSGGFSDVILASNWVNYVETKSTFSFLGDRNGFAGSALESKEIFDRHFEQSIQQIVDAGASVWIVNQVPAYDFLVSQRMAIIDWQGGDPDSLGMSLEDYESDTKFVNSQFEKVSQDDVNVIDVTSILCDEQNCYPQENGRSLYQDATHLSTLGAAKLAPLFEQTVLTN